MLDMPVDPVKLANDLGVKVYNAKFGQDMWPVFLLYAVTNPPYKLTQMTTQSESGLQLRMNWGISSCMPVAGKMTL